MYDKKKIITILIMKLQILLLTAIFPAAMMAAEPVDTMEIGRAHV